MKIACYSPIFVPPKMGTSVALLGILPKLVPQGTKFGGCWVEKPAFRMPL